MFVLDIANGCKWITLALAKDYKDIHPRKLTCPLKRDYFSRVCIFQPWFWRDMLVFRGVFAAEGNSWTPCCSTCLVGFLRMAGQGSISSTQSAAVPGVAISIGILLPHCPGRWNVKLCEIQRGTGNLKTVNILINPGDQRQEGEEVGGISQHLAFGFTELTKMTLNRFQHKFIRSDYIGLKSTTCLLYLGILEVELIFIHILLKSCWHDLQTIFHYVDKEE